MTKIRKIVNNILWGFVFYLATQGLKLMIRDLMDLWFEHKGFKSTVRFAREANNEWVSTIPNKTEEVS